MWIVAECRSESDNLSYFTLGAVLLTLSVANNTFITFMTAQLQFKRKYNMKVLIQKIYEIQRCLVSASSKRVLLNTSKVGNEITS